MTVIALIFRNGKIQMAGDSQTSWGTFMKLPKRDSKDKAVKEYGKLFQVNKYTVGCAGDCAQIGMLQVFMKSHHPKQMDRDSILDWVLEFKSWLHDKAKIAFNDVSVHGIIVHGKKAFTFFDHLEVYPIKEFDAVGSGMNIAIGAMAVGASAKEAVKVCTTYAYGCGDKVTTLEL
jgi:ATP-dependent protease HslVU (ClpYQ) peptidase subunit